MSVTAENEMQFDVHTPTTKVFIARISTQAAPKSTRQQGKWHLVTFGDPTVPIWVSKDYVRRTGDSVTVRVDRLNGRTKPSLNSVIVRQLMAGHRSPVLNESTDFVQILAPADWEFAITDRALKRKWEVTSNSSAVVTPSAESVEPESTAEDPRDDAITPISEERAAEASSNASDATAEEITESAVGEEVATAATDDDSLARLHRIAAGDTISLLVFGEPDLSANSVRVPASGSVSFPLIGATPVVGKTTSEIEQDVAARLEGGYIRNPRLSVTIDSYRPIFIRGAVTSTGSFPFTEGLTLVQAIALAGGSKNSAQRDGVSILRDGATVASGLSVDSQYAIRSGDIISIAEEFGIGEEASSFVYLHGEVKKPGEYSFRRGLTVEKAVVLAGGFTLRASRRKISISREVDGQEEPEKLKKVKLYLPVKPGDIINVGASWF